MKILAFDTCFNKTYIILKNDDVILSEKIIESNEQNYHSAYLIPEIRNILVENNLFIKDLDAIAVNIGPGSFTGIRAGITIARVLAQQFNTKLVGINSMQILSNLNKTKNNTIVALDARKNKIYFSKYIKGEEVVSPCLIDKEDLISKIISDDFVITDKSVFEYLSNNSVSAYCYEDNNDNFALYLANISLNKLQTEKKFNWAEVKPLYIQKPSITLPKAVKNG